LQLVLFYILLGVELINAMQDIKLNNAEMEKRWQWERIQAKLFHIDVEGLKLSQYQEVGAFFTYFFFLCKSSY